MLPKVLLRIRRRDGSGARVSALLSGSPIRKGNWLDYSTSVGPSATIGERVRVLLVILNSGNSTAGRHQAFSHDWREAFYKHNAKKEDCLFILSALA